jgi:hypothetical protein
MKKIILVLAFSAFGYLSLQAGVSGNGCLSKPAQLILNRISQETEVTPEMQNQLKSV